MKTKATAIVGAFLLVFSWAAQAGPRVSVSFGSGCGYAPAAYCRPAVYSTYYPCATPFYYGYYGYGGPVVTSSFSNVSPMVAYGDTPVYRVPDPVLQSAPIVVYPASTFGWRH